MSAGNGKIDLTKLNTTLSELARPIPWEKGRELTGQPLTIRCISGAERDSLEIDRIKFIPDESQKFSKDHMNWEDYRARHAVVFLGDGEGRRVYRDNDAALVSQQWPGWLLDDLLEQGRKYNYMDRESQRRAEKNLPIGQNSASGSTSLAISESPSLSFRDAPPA